jgi:hypothetical protein
MPRVTVALLGPLDGAFTEPAIFDDVDRAKTWDDRQKIDLDVADDEALGLILRRAGEMMGVAGPRALPHEGAPVPSFVAFFNGEQDRQHGGVYVGVTLVDEDGRARWNVPFYPVTFSELQRASDAGVLSGDAQRLYYVTYPGIGNGVLATWPVVLVGLKTMWDLLQIAGTVEDGIGFFNRIRTIASGRIEEGRKALEQHAPDWTERHGDPDSVLRMLGSRPWHAADLAVRLGTDEAQAEAILWTFGFTRDDAGLWRRGGDESADLLGTVFEEIQLSYSLGHQDFRETLEKRFRHQLETGQRAPMPGIDAETYGDRKLVPTASSKDAELPPGETAPAEQEYEDDFLYDEDFEDNLRAPHLPLDLLLVRCGCGKADCDSVAGFGVANGQLKVGLSTDSDHFVIDASFMEQIAGQTRRAIDAAKNPQVGE